MPSARCVATNNLGEVGQAPLLTRVDGENRSITTVTTLINYGCEHCLQLCLPVAPVCAGSSVVSCHWKVEKIEVSIGAHVCALWPTNCAVTHTNRTSAGLKKFQLITVVCLARGNTQTHVLETVDKSLRNALC